MSKDKKTAQLGMSPSTASGRLVKDILFDFVEKSGYTCYHCGEQMTRETFSIEHKVPWLDSEDPVGLFFALDNIHYSHLSCNARAARRKVGVGKQQITGSQCIISMVAVVMCVSLQKLSTTS